MNIDIIKHFGINDIGNQDDAQAITPDVSAVKFAAADKIFVAIMADYFDEDDIKNVFPAAIREKFGVREVKFLSCDYENSGFSDMVRELAFPAENHRWILLAEIK